MRLFKIFFAKLNMLYHETFSIKIESCTLIYLVQDASDNRDDRLNIMKKLKFVCS